MNFYGYIEGFYGREFSPQERRGIVRKLAANGLNSYLIASKEDPYHRLHWRKTPDETYCKELSELIAWGKELDVTVIPAIAPGLSYQFSDPDDEVILIERCRQFVELGADTIGLLMDDLPLELPSGFNPDQTSLGRLHGELTTRIAHALPDTTILFCPTLYTDELFHTGAESERYLQDLADTISDSVTLFWTGKNTIAEVIDEDSCDTITSLFGNRVLFWDNIYANDYATTRLYVGPLRGRDHSFITGKSSGLMLNPTGLFWTDSFLLDLFGEWLRSGSVTADYWQECATSAGIPLEFSEYLRWFSSPFESEPLDILREESRDPMVFFNTLLVEWQGELKKEWYPYLHRFFVELKLAAGKGGDLRWYKQRFYPFSAQKLCNDSVDSGYSIL